MVLLIDKLSLNNTTCNFTAEGTRFPARNALHRKVGGKLVRTLTPYYLSPTHCGGSEIRTRGTITDTQSFQDCPFNHSGIPPQYEGIRIYNTIASLLCIFVAMCALGCHLYYSAIGKIKTPLRLRGLIINKINFRVANNSAIPSIFVRSFWHFSFLAFLPIHPFL